MVHGGPSLGKPSPSSIHIVALEMDRVIFKEEESDVAQKKPPMFVEANATKQQQKSAKH
jgi:hypothetical protein